MSTTQGRTSPTINGVVNGNSAEEAPKSIKAMDKVQEELCEHFRAKENGTLKKKSPAVQPIVKRLLTEKPTESARKEDTERLMLGHGKRNFVIKKSIQNGGSQESSKVMPERKEEVQEISKMAVSLKPVKSTGDSKDLDKEDVQEQKKISMYGKPQESSGDALEIDKKQEVQEIEGISMNGKPFESSGDSLDGSSVSPVNSREETPERENSLEKEIKIEKKPPVPVLQPLQMPKKSPEILRTKSVDITKIIKTPTTPQSPGRKMNHGRPNFTLPSRSKASPGNTRQIPAEFLTVKLRETPNSPFLEPVQVPLGDEMPSCEANSQLPPYRSATLGRKKDSLPPSPLVPAAPTYDGPKYGQKLVVSFAMDLAATPNRYPDRVKVSPAIPARNEHEMPEEVAQLRQKKFSIDLERLSVREQ
uniref:Uncharacterized protein n=1 Tax=Phlebotomus papatasi TaxID=29031 RepID=A0A1B0D723_PHLPP